MRAARPFLIVACLAGALVSTANAADLSVNPCPEATVRCRADDRFLDVTYRLNLHNPTGRRADVRLLSSVDVLESVEGLKGDLVLSKAGSAVRASVPAGWRGLLILRAKQRISRRPAEGTFSARVAIPPALSRIVELDLPGGNVELQVRPRCIVRRTDTDGDRTTFRLLPLQADVLTIEWRQVAPGRRPAYSLHEVHRITERAPGYRDEVTLEFLFPDTAPPMVSARIPAGVSVVAIEASHRAVWTLRQETLEVLVPEGFSSGALSVTCQLEGATSATEDGAAQLLEVPLFASPEAERHTGRVLLTGDLHELNFVALQSATQTAAEDGAWRLACDFRGPGARVLVKIVPIEIPAHASVETFYAVSAFKVDGEHRLSVMRDSAVVPPLEALLPAGHVVRSLSSPVPVNWSQEGWVLHVQTESAIRGPISVEFATEWLIGGKAQVQLGVPVVTTVASSRCAVGIRPAPNIQIKTAGEAETWRVPPGSLPEWMKDRQPSIGYTYTDAPVPVELEILPIEAEIRGQVQEHVTVWEERIQRDSLFLLEISKRPVEELTVLLPAGLNVERVGGPAIEGWELSEDQDELTVRFGGPVQGACHFYLASEQPAAPGRLVLHGIHLEAAPHLKGWLGIGSDVAVAVRPLEDGRLGIGSVRTEQAPAYLKGFDNKLLYEFYDSRWELELATEIVPPVYSAKVLNVFRFRAAQVAVSALFNVTVHEGGVSELDFELPANATGPQFQAPDVVLSQLGPPPPAGEPARGRTLHVRLRGKHTGTFACRLDYGIVSGMGRESIEIAPVRLHGAREQTGLVVLTQARPDAGVKVAPPPRELTPTEAEERYPDWSFTREHPALAAFSYRGDGWKLPVVLTAHPLSEVMLQASIPLAKLDTLVQKGPECINHLRLYVSNTSKQFLTVDLAGAGPEARLIGTYVYGEPVKPFREGKTKLQLPLFTSEKATSTGMAVLDIIYATPHRGLGALRRQTLVPPDLGLNVEQMEWNVRVPVGYGLATVGGNMGKPVGQVAEAQSLAGQLLTPVLRFLKAHAGWIVGFLMLIALCAVLAFLVWVISKFGLARAVVRTSLGLLIVAVVVAVVVLVLATLLMPALSRAREEARMPSQRSDLHNVGLVIAMYRRDHGGAFPPSVGALFTEGYLDDPDFMEWEGQQLVYQPQEPGAPDDAVVAYYWPPGEGTNVLYNDNSVDYVLLDEAGDLVEPRKGVLLARAGTPAPAGGPVAMAARKGFAGVALKAEELEQAFQLEEQTRVVERKALRGGAQVQARAELVDQALVEAKREKIEAAIERYKAEHGGQQPESPDALAPYIGDKRLVDALDASMLALGKARALARAASQSSNLHNVGLGIAMYRKDHGGAFPPSLAGLYTNGYLNDPDLMKWEGQQMVYRPQEPEAPDDAIVAYYWPPKDGGANALYCNMRVDWVDLDRAARLVNPYTSEVIATARGTRVRAAGELREKVSAEVAQRDQLAQTRYSLGMEFMKQGDYDRAAENLRRALNLKKDYKEAERQLAQTEALRLATAKQAAEAAKAAAMPGAPKGGVGGAGFMVADTSARQRGRLEDMANRLTQQEQELAAGEAEGTRGVLVLGDQPVDANGDGLALGRRVGALAVLLPAEPAPTPLVTQPQVPSRARRASLVKQLGGGRSVGALPIAIDFPMPATTSYQFIKPFLGRVAATVSFRPLGRRTAMLIELALAVCALLGYVLIRARRPSAAITFGGAVLTVAVVLLFAASPAVAPLFASTLLAMAACFGAEAINASVAKVRKSRARGA